MDQCLFGQMDIAQRVFFFDVGSFVKLSLQDLPRTVEVTRFEHEGASRVLPDFRLSPDLGVLMPDDRTVSKRARNRALLRSVSR
jgi:hypothetical protein